MTILIPKGAVVICPRKGHRICTAKVDIISGSLASTKQVDFETGQERIAGEPMKCKICGSPYVVQGMIHTKEGWMPHDPVLETPP